MKFETANHHYLIHVENHVALIDLGSPISFSNEDVDFTLGNKAHHIDASPDMISQVNSSDLLKGKKIDILLGLDILAHHCFVLDKATGTCEVDPSDTRTENMHVLPIKRKNLMGEGYTIAKAKFNGIEREFILDTGAWIGYASSLVIGNAPETESISDYNPILGSFTTSKHIVDLEIAGVHDENHPIGLMPKMLEKALGLIGIDVVMGIDDLVTESIILDLPNSLIAFV